MEVMRTIPVIIPDDPDVLETVRAFQMVTQSVSHRAFEMMTQEGGAATRRTAEGGQPPAGGQPTGPRTPPPGAVALHRRCYGDVRGLVSAQMTASAIRLVAGAYRSAWRAGHTARRPFGFRRPLALWLIGDRRRDASLAPDGTLSLWTGAGRRRLPCRVPDHFREQLGRAVRVNSLTVTADPADTDLSDIEWDDDGETGGGHGVTRGPEHGGTRGPEHGDDADGLGRDGDGVGRDGDGVGRDGDGEGEGEAAEAPGVRRVGRLRAWLTVTVAVPDPAGHSPVGIDRGAVNALVAVDADDRVLFLSGRGASARNGRTRRVQGRVREKRAAREAAGRDTRSVRRLLGRLSRKQHDRNRDFARRAALALCRWAPPGAVFVFEDLRLPAALPARAGQTLGYRPGWSHGLLRGCIQNKAEEWGFRVVSVCPAYTSSSCSRCGAPGRRRGESFRCPACGHAEHSDINAGRNIRNAGYGLLNPAHERPDAAHERPDTE